MGVSPVYGWPLDVRNDPPAGYKWRRELALAIEQTLQQQIANVYTEINARRKPLASAAEGTTRTGLDNTSMETTPGTLPLCATTFVAPKSGVVAVAIQAGLRASGGARGQADVIVREDNASGLVVYEEGDVVPNALVGTSTDETSYTYGGASVPVDGLTADATYWVAVTTRCTTGGGTYDVSQRLVTVQSA